MLENMKRFKIFTKAWIFSLALLGMGISQPAVAETSVWDGSMVRFSKGNGSPENPFQINTAEEMAYLIAFYDHTLVAHSGPSVLHPAKARLSASTLMVRVTRSPISRLTFRIHQRKRTMASSHS